MEQLRKQSAEQQTVDAPLLPPADAAAIARMVQDRQEGGLSRTLHDVLMIAWRNLLLEMRSPAALIASTAFSISLFCVFAASFSNVVFPGESYSTYAQFLLPFTIVQGLLFNTVNISNYFYTDLANGMDTRLRSMPIARLSALGGRVLSSAVRLLILVAGIVIAGYLLGFRFQGGLLSVILFFITPIIFTLSVALLGFYIAVGAKSSEAVAAVINPWILPLTFLSIGYVPRDAFPNWALWFVDRNPVSVASETMRALANGELAFHSLGTTLLWSAALSLVFGTLTVRAYQKRTQ